MVRICPTITAYSTEEYKAQITQIKPFAQYTHIDLMDGEFAPTKSVPVDGVWWPHELRADIHIMYQRPMEYIDLLVRLKPYMVVIHAEADVHHMHFAAELHKHDIKAGLCILQDTSVASIEQIMHSFDQILVFSGHLGYHGGEADLGLLEKVRQIKALYPEVEIGWDGGITAENAPALVEAGVTVLNVGGYIQKSQNPQAAYATLKEAINE